MVHVGLSLMFEEAFRHATLPLFEAGLVDALEYSFEIGWTYDPPPAWVEPLLDHYAAAQRLWGHGVTMSPLSAVAKTRQMWLSRVAEACRRRSYVGVSEHVGFMEADGVDGGAPLPVPPGPGGHAVGIRSLTALAEVTGRPVGLENLALALGPADVWSQGDLLHAVLEATDGYLVLDLHNLWCQVVNYGVDAGAVLATYPLHRVRCIHLSGGRYTEPAPGGPARRFRRDSHDGDVPDPVHELLEAVLPRCPGLEVVTLERLGATIADEAAASRLRDDFARIRRTVEHNGHG